MPAASARSVVSISRRSSSRAVADDQGVRRVRDPAVDRRGEVDAEQVAVDQRVVVGESVQHRVVDRGAEHLAERRGPERRVVVDVAGLGAAVLDHPVRERVQVEQVHAYVGGVREGGDHRGDELAGRAHLLDLRGRPELDHAGEPMAQGHRGADQGQVRERLWEVARHPRAGDVVLLAEQADVVGESQQALHQPPRVVGTAREGVRRHQPERAGQERVLVAGDAVDAGLGPVAEQQPVAHQVGFHGRDRAEDPRIVARQEADLRDRQQRGIDLGGVVVLGERAAAVVEATTEYLLAHPVPKSPPLVDRPLEPVPLHGAHRPVERHPDHHPAVREVSLRTADLPQAVVGLRPAVASSLTSVRWMPQLCLTPPSPAPRARSRACITSPRTSSCCLHGGTVADPHGRERRTREGGPSPFPG